MNENNKGLIPAFPFTYEMTMRGEKRQFSELGISKRYFTATMCMQGLLANSQFRKDVGGSPCELVKYAYEITDELLKQEEFVLHQIWSELFPPEPEEEKVEFKITDVSSRYFGPCFLIWSLSGRRGSSRRR